MGILEQIRTDRRKKFWRIILGIILLGGAIAGYYRYRGTGSTTQYTYYTVRSGSIESAMSADGKVKYRELYDLNFKNGGTLAKVFRNEGEAVKKGETIAMLDDTYLKIDLEKAKIALESAKANLDAKLATRASATDVNISQKQLESSKTSLETGISQGKAEVASAEESLASVMKDLENARSNLQIIGSQDSLRVGNAEDNGVATADKSLPIIANCIREIDVLGGFTPENVHLNDTFEKYLGAANPKTMVELESSFNAFRSSQQDFLASWASFRKAEDLSKLETKMTELEVLENSLVQTIDKALRLLEDSISSTVFPQTSIDEKIRFFQTQKNTVISLKQEGITSRQTIANAILTRNTDLQTQKNLIGALETKVSLAETALENAKTKLQNTTDLANSQVSISQATLENKQSPFDSRELRPLNVSIEQAKKNVEEAQKRLDDARIVSPIDGSIGKISTTKIGTIIGQANANTPFVSVIRSDSMYIEAQIEEGDINSVHLGQEVKLTFNSLEGVALTGSVISISDKAQIDTNGIVSYKVETSFKPVRGVKEGFTTQIAFMQKKIESAVLAPIEAIIERSGGYIATSETGIALPVQVGINDGESYEIRSGLKTGDILRK